ncbi:MAG: tRNA epoxyqueuosine(34) reductase QueG [Actinomycetota bacterium]|nr:tRNA epoxyqueuosine(34) reductase QueG [Actinomycetota bacterium]
MSPSLLTSELHEIGKTHGLDSIGFAKAEIFASTKQHLIERKRKGLHGGMQFTYRNPERSTDPSKTLNDAQTLIVGAKSYWRKQSNQEPPQEPHGRIALYAQEDHYAQLYSGLEAISKMLEDHGYRARVLVDDNALVDREAAYRAGIGWYGKNTNLLLPKRGSWFVLGSVVTNAKFAPSTPHQGSCGTCEQCIPACPTQAISSSGILDANRCLAWLLQSEGQFPIEFREALGNRIYGCDDCQTVCPANRKEERISDQAHSNGIGETTSIYEMLEMSDHDLLEKYGKWYIPRRDPRYLRRNALVVLGNGTAPPSRRTIHALQRCLKGNDDMIRSHAVWAAKRLKLTELLEDLFDDPSPLVQEELAREIVTNLKT